MTACNCCGKWLHVEWYFPELEENTNLLQLCVCYMDNYNLAKCVTHSLEFYNIQSWKKWDYCPDKRELN